MAIRFLKYAVTDGEFKAKVFYSLDNRTDGRKCVTLYERGYEANLTGIFPKDARGEGLVYKNDTDTQTDYFDKGHVNIFEGHPLYAAARARAEARDEGLGPPRGGLQLLRVRGDSPKGEGDGMTEQQIVHETANFYVVRKGKGFEVYQIGAVAAHRVAQIGYHGQKGLDRAKEECTRRERLLASAGIQAEIMVGKVLVPIDTTRFVCDQFKPGRELK